jgi:hypothetical protein
MIETFKPGDLYDKTLYAKKSVNIYTTPSSVGTKLRTISPGDMVGVIWSHVMRDGVLWWQLYDNNKLAYVSHAEGKFSLEDLKAQGLVSTQQKEADKKAGEKTWYEKLFDSLGGTVTKVVIISGVAYVITTIIKSKTKN